MRALPPLVGSPLSSPFAQVRIEGAPGVFTDSGVPQRDVVALLRSGPGTPVSADDIDADAARLLATGGCAMLGGCRVWKDHGLTQGQNL